MDDERITFRIKGGKKQKCDTIDELIKCDNYDKIIWLK